MAATSASWINRADPAPIGPFDFHHQRLSAFISGFL
jgi:hypothetical protein